MPVELAICRYCGSDNLEVIEPAGPGVGQQFACGDCLRIANSCALQDAEAPAVDLDAVEAQIHFTERSVRALSSLIVDSMMNDADRRIADREEWKGLSW